MSEDISPEVMAREWLQLMWEAGVKARDLEEQAALQRRREAFYKSCYDTLKAQGVDATRTVRAVR